MRSSQLSAAVSRRTALAGLGVGGAGMALAASTRKTLAQDTTPVAMAGHPLIGAWYVSPPDPNPTPGPALVSFTADGICTQIDPLRGNGIGSWAATGAHTALVTLVFTKYAADDPTRFDSLAVGRDLVEVDATGDAFTGQGELEFRSADGATLSGPFGPLPFSGKRLLVEPMQTTPVATPTS